jgi:hypothetical protein
MSWLTLSPIVVMGALDSARIEARIEAIRPALVACVAEAPPGALTMRLVFGKGGRVLRVAVQGGDPNEAVSLCFSDALQALTVPQPRCGCTIIIVDQPIAWGQSQVTAHGDQGINRDQLPSKHHRFASELLELAG